LRTGNRESSIANRPAISEAQTLVIMHGGRCRHFDPAVFDVCRDLLPQLRTICEEMDE
jgi:hypothetical protein